MTTVPLDMTRRELIQSLKAKRQRLQHVNDMHIQWARLCNSSGHLAISLGLDDPTLTAYLIDFSTKAGQRAKACNIETNVLKREIGNLSQILGAGDKLKTWRELRDEETEWMLRIEE